LKSDGRLRSVVETWNTNAEDIDIIRWLYNSMMLRPIYHFGVGESVYQTGESNEITTNS
jgi:hypothetical protein